MAKKFTPAPIQLKKLPIAGRIVIWLLFSLYLGLFFAKPINLTTADLGRHIINGQYFVENGWPIETNHYSYTEPEYPAVNHHWASGVIFYYVWKLADFKGSSAFYIIVSLLGALLFVWMALRRADDRIVLFIAAFLAPLIAYRTEIRPEGLSYVFLGISYLLLDKFRKKEINFRQGLIYFSILQVAWINCHIFFFLGPTLMALHFIADLINGLDKQRIKEYSILMAVSSMAGIINPFLLEGLLTPFTIFQEFGYMLAENQSVFFMQDRFHSPEFVQVEVLAGLLLVAFIFIAIKKQWRNFLPEILTILFFGGLAFAAVRGITMFALLSIPIGAKIVQYFLYHNKQSIVNVAGFGLLGLPIILMVLGMLNDNDISQPDRSKVFSYYSPIERYNNSPMTGLGLMENINGSADFFKKTGMKGPIFNNYDIGGYLIFHLYGKEKVFVDNRPEAYSVPFFKEIYIPMQEDEAKWNEYVEKYHINVIWFYRHDNTPWGQPFLIKRVEDYKNWAPVFVDNYTIIFMKRTVDNEPWIKQFELPQEMFRSVPSS